MNRTVSNKPVILLIICHILLLLLINFLKFSILRELLQINLNHETTAFVNVILNYVKMVFCPFFRLDWQKILTR